MSKWTDLKMKVLSESARRGGNAAVDILYDLLVDLIDVEDNLRKRSRWLKQTADDVTSRLDRDLAPNSLGALQGSGPAFDALCAAYYLLRKHASRLAVKLGFLPKDTGVF